MSGDRTIDNFAISLPAINKGDLLAYIRSEFRSKSKFPQLRLELFLPQAQQYLLQLKRLEPQERSVMWNEYTKLISRLLLELEMDHEIVTTFRSVVEGRVPIIEVYDYGKDRFKKPRKTGVIKKHQIKNWFTPRRVKAVLVIAVVIFFGGVFNLFYITEMIPEDQIVIEKYDEVEIYYLLWLSNQDHDIIVEDPFLEIIYNLEVVPSTENWQRGVILGLYDNLLGKPVDYRSEFIWLKNCVDRNNDGIDDVTGERALSYGNESDALFNACLIIRFIVLEIVKTE